MNEVSAYDALIEEQLATAIGKKVYMVIINGLGGTGKSTFIKMCKDYAGINHPDMLVEELSLVDYVKRVASMCGWEGKKDQKDRIFLSDLKKAFEKWNNMPIKYVFYSVSRALSWDQYSTYMVFINSREPNDIKKLLKNAQKMGYHSTVLLMTNKNVENNEVPELVEGINSIEYDVTINNDGNLEALKTKAGKFVEFLLKK